jgi:hypothetical protein
VLSKLKHGRVLMDTPWVGSMVFEGRHLRTHCRENAIHETAKNSFQEEVTMRTHSNCIVIVAVAAVLLSSSLSMGASVEVTGDFKVNGVGSGVVFPDGTVQTTAAAPTWHQILPAAQRFVMVMNNQAVLDKETGLVWEQSPTATPIFTWLNAQQHCNALTVGNRMGWRLPTIQELSSLVDPTQSDPALPAGAPFSNVQSSGYWSATTLASDAGVAFVVLFDIGGVTSAGKSLSGYAWCVRGGQGVDPQ